MATKGKTNAAKTVEPKATAIGLAVFAQVTAKVQADGSPKDGAYFGEGGLIIPRTNVITVVGTTIYYRKLEFIGNIQEVKLKNDVVIYITDAGPVIALNPADLHIGEASNAAVTTVASDEAADEEDEDEDDEPAPKKRGAKKAVEVDEEDDEDDEDDEPAPKKRGKKVVEEEDEDEDDEPAPKKRGKKVVEEEDEDEDDESSEEDEDDDEPAPKKRAGRKPARDEEDEDDDEPAPKKRGKKVVAEEDGDEEEMF